MLRLLLAIVFFAHGSQKVLGWFGGHGLYATVHFMALGLGIPRALVLLAAFVEFLGGIGMLLGLATRFWGLGLAIDMAVAIAKVHGPHGFFAPMGFEYPFTLLACALGVALLGPGSCSLDALIAPVGDRNRARRSSERFYSLRR